MFALLRQAAFDLIARDERSQLLQNLASSLIKNATAANEIDAVVFVTVDLINRIKHEDVTDSSTRFLYGTMNEKAGQKALLVPDFNSALKYTESALSFLDESHWLSHRDLMLSIHQTSVAALYSNTESNQDLFRERIDLVFQYAVTLDDEFRTRLVWIKWLSSSSLQDAINECHILLERLGEPIDPSDTSLPYVCSEAARVLKTIEEEHCLSVQMTEPNKIKAMEVMSSLHYFYHYQRNYKGVFVTLRMVELSMEFGCSKDSFFALACFAALLIAISRDISSGYSWAKMTLALLFESGQNINAIMPAVVSSCCFGRTPTSNGFKPSDYRTCFILQTVPLHGYVMYWLEPLQSTLDPLLSGCRMGFEYGNFSDAMNNAKVVT